MLHKVAPLDVCKLMKKTNCGTHHTGYLGNMLQVCGKYKHSPAIRDFENRESRIPSIPCGMQSSTSTLDKVGGRSIDYKKSAVDKISSL